MTCTKFIRLLFESIKVNIFNVNILDILNNKGSNKYFIVIRQFVKVVFYKWDMSLKLVTNLEYNFNEMYVWVNILIFLLFNSE